MNAPVKIIAKSKLSEWRGLDRINLIVHGMKCIWREQEKDDVGIDGEIELCRPRFDGDGAVATGKILKVQSKSGSSFVIRDREDSFASPVAEKDLHYWRGVNVPVIYVVFHPDDDTLYWKDIQAYLRDNPDALKAPRRIEFSKADDRFDEDAYPALLALCEAAPERVSTEVGETLFTNLLRIERRPAKVWIAPVLPQKQFGFHDRLTGIIPPYVYKGGLLHTLSDPSDRDTAFAAVVDAGGIEEIDLEEWIAQSPEYENDLARLMNGLVHRHLRGIGLSYEKRPRRYFYNRGLAVDASIQKRWTSGRTSRTQTRTVAKHYEYGKLKFFRHQALDYGFERYGDLWAIAINPQLMFTTDGTRPWVGEAARSYAISARVEEYNDAYLNNILFWAHQMSGGRERFELRIGGDAVAEASGVPITAEAAFSIQSNGAPPRKRQKGD